MEDYYSANISIGWEAERVVPVTVGGASWKRQQEPKPKREYYLSRGRGKLAKTYYKSFRGAADKGLVELLISANESESTNENEMKSECNPCCATEC